MGFFDVISIIMECALRVYRVNKVCALSTVNNVI